MTDASDHPPHLKLEMLSQPQLLSAARAMVGNVAHRIGFSEPHCSHITLAVDEALCNVINHGYARRPDGLIWLNVWASDPESSESPEIRIVIEDRATQVDPTTIQPRDLDEIRPGGLGVYIIREVMDDVRYERRDGQGMRLTMTKKLPTTPQSPETTAAADSAESPNASPSATAQEQKRL